MKSKNVFRGCILRIAIGITVLALLLAGGAEGATLIVDDSGSADFARIQDAIDDASDGDTILVYSGTYYENVNVNKQLILRGTDNGEGKPVVNTSGEGRSVAIRLQANGITLERFKVITRTSIGILVNSYNNTIANNDVSNSTYGIYVLARNNTIADNDVSSTQTGIYVETYSNNNTIVNNHVSNTHTGIYVGYYSNNNTIVNNDVSNLTYGIYVLAGNNTIANNDVSNNDYGISVWNSRYNIIRNNIVRGSKGTVAGAPEVTETPGTATPLASKPKSKVPGFEIVVALTALSICILWRKRR